MVNASHKDPAHRAIETGTLQLRAKLSCLLRLTISTHNSNCSSKMKMRESCCGEIKQAEARIIILGVMKIQVDVVTVTVPLKNVTISALKTFSRLRKAYPLSPQPQPRAVRNKRPTISRSLSRCERDSEKAAVLSHRVASGLPK